MHSKDIPNPQLMRTFPYNWAYPFNTFASSQNQYASATQISLSTPNITYSRTNPQFKDIRLIKVQEKSYQEKQQLEPMLQQGNSNQIIEQGQICKLSNPYHPPKVCHQVVFFDPTTAPTLTCPSYNLVSMRHEEQLSEFRFRGKPHPQINELQHSEKDENPFIIFKYRRLKKKSRVFFKFRGGPEEIEQLESSSQEFERSESEQRMKKIRGCKEGEFKGTAKQQGSLCSNEGEESEK